MNPADIRIVYMGTPEFAIAPLEALAREGFNICAVITSPDKPAGRGMKLQQSAVKQFAVQNLHCPVLQPQNLKDPHFVEELSSFRAHLFLVVAFRMLPEMVWSLPEKGTINLHASLLPQYRGAAPINHVLINGEKESGVTTFLIDKKIDTGKILLRERISIGAEDDAGILHDKLMVLGAELVVRTVRQIALGETEPILQESFNIPEDQLKKAPKIFREECRIVWDQSAERIYNFIRGLSPFPTAFSELQGNSEKNRLFKIYSGSIIREKHTMKPGTIRSDNTSYIHVAVADGFYSIHSLQPEGKRQLPVEEFLRGFQGGIDRFSFI